MGTIAARSIVLPLVAMTAMLSVAACREPQLVKIGDKWHMDAVPPGKTARRLYHDAGNGPILVDRAVEKHRFSTGGFCLMYESSRPEGRIVFAVAGRLTPLAVAATNAWQPWHLDADGLRKFEGPVDVDQGRMLTVEWIDAADICHAAQLQPQFQKDWAQNARVEPSRFKVQKAVLDVHGQDSVGNSTLSEAARLGQTSVVDELIRAGADVNSANQSGGTVLMTAIAFRHPEIVGRLLQAGALVDAQDVGGGTALMTAAHFRNPEMAKILLDAGASATIRDNRGMTALARVPDGDAAELRELRALLQRAAPAK